MAGQNDKPDAIRVAAIDFISKRRRRLELKAERNSLVCEEISPSPAITDACEHPCWFTGEYPYDQWCETCKRRGVVHAEYHRMSSLAGGALRRLERRVAKLETD